MGKWGRTLMILLFLSLLVTLSVAPAFAYWPDWLERLFRLFVSRTPTPVPTFTPTPTPSPLPTYVITTPEEGLNLLKELPKGKAVRVVFRENDINRYLAHYAERYQELHSAWVDLERGEIAIRISVDSIWLREEGWKMFPARGTVKLEARVKLQARGCKPSTQILSFKVNGRSTFWRRLIGRTASAYLRREWRNVPFCVREIRITGDSIVITGYKTKNL